MVKIPVQLAEIVAVFSHRGRRCDGLVVSCRVVSALWIRRYGSILGRRQSVSLPLRAFHYWRTFLIRNEQTAKPGCKCAAKQSINNGRSDAPTVQSFRWRITSDGEGLPTSDIITKHCTGAGLADWQHAATSNSFYRGLDRKHRTRQCWTKCVCVCV